MSNSTSDVEVTIVPPVQEHTATIIFCHGLGQTASQYDIDIQWMAQRLPFVKWVRPQASVRRVTHAGGGSIQRPTWFNVWDLPPRINEFDEIGVAESISIIERLILTEIHNGLDPKKILLVGFSQGAALCLMTALTTLQELGGVGSLSGWIPHPIREHIEHNEPSLPIFWAHGKNDLDIPVQYARNSIEFLEQRLCMNEENLRYIEYADMGHEISEDVLRDLTQWMLDILTLTRHP